MNNVYASLLYYSLIFSYSLTLPPTPVRTVVLHAGTNDSVTPEHTARDKQRDGIVRLVCFAPTSGPLISRSRPRDSCRTLIPGRKVVGVPVRSFLEGRDASLNGRP